MSDDLRRELTQVNREIQDEERRRLDERWDRLSSGELSAEEEAELRALAASSEEAREAWEAFRPLGPDFHASVVRAIRDQGSAPVDAPAKAPAEPLPFRRRASRLAGWGSLAAAAAAAVVVLLVRPAAPLPWYSPPEVSGGVHTSRGEEAAEAEVPVVTSGGRVQVIVRPQAAISRAPRLEAFCFLTRGRELHLLEVHNEIDSGGSIKMKGSIGGIQPGAWRLWTVIGRRGKLPHPADLRLHSVQARERDWVAVSREIRIQPQEHRP